MKLTIDTTNKQVTLLSDENLGEFIKAVQVLLPEGEWEKYKLVTNTVVTNWNPIYITPYNRSYPWWQVNSGSLTAAPTGHTLTGDSGSYQVEFNAGPTN